MHRAIPRLPSRVLAQCFHHRPLTIRFLSTASDSSTDESSSITTFFRRKLWGTDNPPTPSSTPQTPSPPTPTPTTPATATAASAPDIDGYVEETDARWLPIAGLEPGLARYDIRTFAPPPPTAGGVDVRDVHTAVHRAVVEVFTRVVNGLEPEVRDGGVGMGIGVGQERDGWTGGVGISVMEDGGVEFLYESEEVERKVLGEWGGGGEVGVEAETAIDAEVDDGEEAETLAETEAGAEIIAQYGAQDDKTELDANYGAQDAQAELDANYGAQDAQAEVEAWAGAEAQREAQREAQLETEAAEEGPEATEPPPSFEEEPTPQWLEEGLQGRGWVHLPLRTNDIKFAIFKRVYQLTSLLPRDADIPRITTASKLIEAITEKPRPKKLFETLKETEAAALPNVRLLATKMRPWDKARVVGMERPIEKVVEYKYAFEE